MDLSVKFSSTMLVNGFGETVFCLERKRHGLHSVDLFSHLPQWLGLEQHPNVPI